MANQYSRGKTLTPIELLEDENEILRRRAARFDAQLESTLAVLVEAYKKLHDPDMVRHLLLHGVKVHDIDRELGRETIYTTPRNRDVNG
jgi:hypothetical protein